MMEFKLSDKEEENLKKFIQNHKHSDVNKGAIGGHISVTFNCTSIGNFPSVKCSVCGEKEDICDYDNY